MGAPSDILVERDGEQYRAPDQASYQVRFFSVPTYITRVKHIVKIFLHSNLLIFLCISNIQPMPEFNNLSLQDHGAGGVADDPYGSHSSRPSFYGGCGYSREYWRNLAGPDYHRGASKLSPGSVPRHAPSSPRHASPGGSQIPGKPEI